MDGVFSDMKNGREDLLRLRLKEAFNNYSAVFPELNSPDDLAKYLENLQPKMRELLLEVANFVGIIYNKLDAVPEYLRDATTLVLMFSIIETLQLATKKYVEFSHWLQSKECASKLEQLLEHEHDTGQMLKSLTEDYFSTYGSIHAATDFFENFLSKKEKQQMIQDYRVRKKCLERVWKDTLRMMLPAFDRTMTVVEVTAALDGRVKVGEEFLPECYCTACFVDYGNCWPKFGCRLDDDEEALRRNLEKVTKRLVYSYRNAFVHKSRLPIMAGSAAHVFDYLEDRLILHTLDMDFLIGAFRNAFRKFFDAAKQNDG
jgi:hypothetical protein